jgi:hypothetical protein
MKFILVTMPDGSVWKVLASAVASNRAEYFAYADLDTNADADTQQSAWRIAFDRDYQEVINDDTELLDWAANNMNWTDVAYYSAKVSEPEQLTPEQFQEGWINGEKRIVNE